MLLDAHFHLWDPASQPHGWLAALPALDRRFGPRDYEETAHSAGVGSGVLVQALADPGETEELLAIAAAHEVVVGVIGWVDLARGDVAEQIARLRALPGGDYLVGLRHLVQDEPDPRWLLRDVVGDGIEALARAGLAYDLLIRPRELEVARILVAAHRQARFVLDHGAKPAIAEGAFEPWASAIVELAALPNLTC
jgi:L-fuconolactonase